MGIRTCQGYQHLTGVNKDESDYFLTNPIIDDLQAGIESYLKSMVPSADLPKYCEYRVLSRSRSPVIFETTEPSYWSKSAEELQLNNLMQTIWANFSRTGNPSFNCSVNGKSFNITWPEYTDKERQVVRLDLTPGIEEKFRRERFDLDEKMLFLSPTYHWSEFYSGIELLY